jgi:hypothetical protein
MYYRLDGRGGVRFPAVARNSSLFFTASKPVFGPIQLSMQWVRKAASLGVKRPVSEANDSPTSNADYKNVAPISSLPLAASWCGVRLSAGTNLTFYLLRCSICILVYAMLQKSSDEGHDNFTTGEHVLLQKTFETPN